MSERALAGCRRTSGIVRVLLDGAETPAHRSHIAGCATCRSASERVARFDRGLVAAAAEVIATIPAPDMAPSRRNLKVATMATLAGAVAVGVVMAAVIIGTRTPPTGSGPPGAFASVASVRGPLALLGLVCGDVPGGEVCQSTALDHTHRVSLTEAGGRVVEVEARIESNDGERLDKRGAEQLLARFAAAALAPDVGAATARWLQDAWPSCDSGCSTELADVSLRLAQDSSSVSLVLRER